MWAQRQVVLDPLPRGCHLVTRAVVDAVPEIGAVQIGLAQVFLQHTSASLTLNENASPDVRRDLDAWLDDAVREDAPYWTHTIEGPDDMPAHVKAALTQTSLAIPITDGRLALGTWQGVYLFEHRRAPHRRKLLVHVTGA